MEQYPVDYSQAMEYSYSAQSFYSSPTISQQDSYTSSPYDDLSAMMPFDLGGYFSPQQLDSNVPFGLGSRPIEIPQTAASHNAFNAFTPSPYSSSPGAPSPYSPSPFSEFSATSSQSSFSAGSGGRHTINSAPLMTYQVQPVPVMMHAGSPNYFLPQAAPAAAAAATSATMSSPVGPGQTYRAPQRMPAEKPARSFDCKKCGKLFTRLADVKRHETSVHDPVPIDCPVENCVRKGTIGFPRRDHLIEHLRTFHNKDIPKRSVNKKRKSNPML